MKKIDGEIVKRGSRSSNVRVNESSVRAKAVQTKSFSGKETETIKFTVHFVISDDAAVAAVADSAEAQKKWQKGKKNVTTTS